MNIEFFSPDTCQEYAEISHIWKSNKNRKNTFSFTTQHRAKCGGQKNHKDLILTAGGQ